jgi:hypothetical protein
MEYQFMARGWHAKSEGNYFFGPFKTEEKGNEFCEKMEEMGYTDVELLVLNHPSKANTGEAVN